MRVHDSQAYRKIDMTRERISRILELREILLTFQTIFNLVSATVSCAILESLPGLEPSSAITEPRYLKLVTVSSLIRYYAQNISGSPTVMAKLSFRIEGGNKCMHL